jgi:hypothetical protein
VSDEIIKALIEGVFDWPFIFAVAVGIIFIKYRAQFEVWISKVSEVKFGDIQFKIGKDEVPLKELDTAITNRLRELQEEIEKLKADNIPKMDAMSENLAGEEIPEGLQKIMIAQVYPMLKSNLWLGRYVKTLAKTCSVTEETMLKFCRARDDIGLFNDGGRWVAALKDRLDGKN